MGDGNCASAVLMADGAGLGCHRLVLSAGLQPSPVQLQGPALQQLAALTRQAVTSVALLGDGPPQGAVVVVAGSWRLSLSQLNELQSTLVQCGLNLVGLESSNPYTRVAASALGLMSTPSRAADPPPPADTAGTALQVHQGTLRSGDHLETAGSVLLLGDVNPGARITAGGHVLVWGRLRGIAHAGCRGDSNARIVALQLRPLQLRIAAAVARGPEGSPPAGLAEEARIVNGAIQIDPAAPSWPLSG